MALFFCKWINSFFQLHDETPCILRMDEMENTQLKHLLSQIYFCFPLKHIMASCTWAEWIFPDHKVTQKHRQGSQIKISMWVSHFSSMFLLSTLVDSMLWFDKQSWVAQKSAYFHPYFHYSCLYTLGLFHSKFYCPLHQRIEMHYLFMQYLHMFS